MPSRGVRAGRGTPSGWGYVKSNCNPEKGGRGGICPGSIFLAQYNNPASPFLGRGRGNVSQGNTRRFKRQSLSFMDSVVIGIWVM